MTLSFQTTDFKEKIPLGEITAEICSLVADHVKYAIVVWKSHKTDTTIILSGEKGREAKNNG